MMKLFGIFMVALFSLGAINTANADEPIYVEVWNELSFEIGIWYEIDVIDGASKVYYLQGKQSKWDLYDYYPYPEMRIRLGVLDKTEHHELVLPLGPNAGGLFIEVIQDPDRSSYGLLRILYSNETVNGVWDLESFYLY